MNLLWYVSYSTCMAKSSASLQSLKFLITNYIFAFPDGRIHYLTPPPTCMPSPYYT